MAEQSEFQQRMVELGEALKGLQAIQRQIVAAAHEIQDVLTFGAHPELVALDDELDILYRGQL